MDIKSIEQINKEIEALNNKRTSINAERQVLTRNLNEKLEQYKETYGVDLRGSSMEETSNLIQREFNAVSENLNREAKLGSQVISLIKENKINEARALLEKNKLPSDGDSSVEPVKEVQNEKTAIQEEEKLATEERVTVPVQQKVTSGASLEKPIKVEEPIQKTKNNVKQAPVIEDPRSLFGFDDDDDEEEDFNFEPVNTSDEEEYIPPSQPLPSRDVFDEEEPQESHVKMNSAPNFGPLDFGDDDDVMDDEEIDEEVEESVSKPSNAKNTTPPPSDDFGFSFEDDDDDDDGFEYIKDLLQGSQFDVGGDV